MLREKRQEIIDEINIYNVYNRLGRRNLHRS